MKNSLIKGSALLRGASCAPDDNEIINCMADCKSFIRVFNRMDIQAGIIFAGAEEGIHLAPGRITGQETIIRPDPAKQVVYCCAQRIPEVEGMV